MTEETIGWLEDHDPRLLFVQLNHVDEVGHQSGFGSDEYFAAIRQTDVLLGELLEAVDRHLDPDRTLVIVMADHGGTRDGYHGGVTDSETECMFAVRGHSVLRGEKIKDMEIRDVAPVVLYALGIDAPESYTGRIPKGIFKDVGGGERPVGTVTNQSAKYRTYHAPETTLFPETGPGLEKLVYRNTFDDTAQCPGAREKDMVQGYFGRAQDMHESFCPTESVWSEDRKNLCVAFWIRSEPTTWDPVIAADKDWKSGKNQGFVLAQTRSGIKFNLADGESHRFDVRFSIPSDFYEGWTHYIFNLDTDNRTVTGYCDFKRLFSEEIPAEVDLENCRGGNSVVIGQDITEAYDSRLPAAMDEFMIFSDVLTEEEIEQLRKYYEPIPAA